MIDIRKYGDAPYRVAVVHGGPGAPGSVAAIARELSTDCGVLEPLQTTTSLDGQVEELRSVIAEHGTLPVVLIGHSWGAWLSYIVAARYPELVGKLILVDSGPFEAHYVSQIGERRRNRLAPDEQVEFGRLLNGLEDPTTPDKDRLLARLGELVEKADNYDLLPAPVDNVDELGTNGDLYQSVWSEAAALRKSGELLQLGALIRCPVLAIHGVSDPHPVAGVQEPLARTLRDFRFVELERCGHSPWRERYARDEFYELLRRELAAAR